MSWVTRGGPVFEVFNQVQHKPGCKTTEDGKRLEILDLGSICSGTVLCSQNKGTYQLYGYCTDVFTHTKIRFSLCSHRS